MTRNIGAADRIVRLVAGIVLILLPLADRLRRGDALAVVGGARRRRGHARHRRDAAPARSTPLLGVSTCPLRP